jgi:hypothetical protein
MLLVSIMALAWTAMLAQVLVRAGPLFAGYDSVHV